MGPFNSCSSWCPGAFRGRQAALISHGEHELPNAPGSLRLSWTKASASAASLPGAEKLELWTVWLLQHPLPQPTTCKRASWALTIPWRSLQRLQRVTRYELQPFNFFVQGEEPQVSPTGCEQWNSQGLPRVTGGTITASGVPVALK